MSVLSMNCFNSLLWIAHEEANSLVNQLNQIMECTENRRNSLYTIKNNTNCYNLSSITRLLQIKTGHSVNQMVCTFLKLSL